MNKTVNINQEFKNYFDENKDKIDYFLYVWEMLKEDEWECQSDSKCELDGITMEHYIHETVKLIYDNVNIIYYNKNYLVNENKIVDKIIITVGKFKIFETNDMTDELSTEIVDFVKRVKEVKGGRR